MQNIFYILGYKREEINIENTHILNWKKVKELITEDFIFYLQQYTHKGCKNEYVEYYQSINRITQKMQKYNQQEVDDYNIGYGKLFRWLVESCRLRKVDIEIRRQNI